LEISILNILLNARDAYLIAPSVETEDRVVRIAVTADEGFVVLAISDQAGGIPASLIDRLFDSFVSSKEKRGGMGVGLSICRRAVESMRGTIKAENRGGGACLTITLPVVET
jgi:signal transduction histidine kinase